MNTGHRIKGFARLLGVAALLLTLGACTEDPSQGDTHQTVDDEQTSTAKTTTISGKVSLSGIVASSKPGYKVEQQFSAPHGKPGSKAYMASKRPVGTTVSSLPGFAAGDPMSYATVQLYNADHPEWMSPVAVALTDSSGNYTFDELQNSVDNGNAYRDGDPIPAGNYTLIAAKFDPGSGENFVAVQTIVQAFAGNVVGNDLAAQPSDVSPTVQTIAGQKKNMDGTQTWGNANVTMAPNAAVQVTFSMAMARDSVVSGISLSPAADGKWTVSPDWTSATFYPADGTIAAGPYTITINGEDSSTFPIRNVYGNALEKTAVGTFTVSTDVDDIKPTAALVSPLAPTGVDVITPVRVGSNELLDINNLVLSATPSLGAKPGVIYLGATGTPPYQYVYEFTLGNPLALNTTYDIKVQGGTDLAGNVMNPLAASFKTAAATDSDGIDSGATEETQTAQARVKDVFGKWTRAMSDRNLTQLQGLMTGDFVFEYDPSIDGLSEEDLNKDGRLNLNEFSAMMEKSFRHWEHCKTDIVGTITETINVTGDTAGFAFTLEESSQATATECQQGGPSGTLYAIARNVNGGWYVGRAAEGLDIRNKTLAVRNVISLVSPAHDAKLSEFPSPLDSLTGRTLKLEWTPLDVGVTSYIVVLMDANNGEKGAAIAVNGSSFTIDLNAFDPMLPNNGLPASATDVSKYFFQSDESSASMFDLDITREGAQYRWLVIGQGSNTVDAFKAGTNKSLFRDIVAISKARRYTNAGTFKELMVEVLDLGGRVVSFSEYIWGYDADAAAQVTVKFTTPNDPAGVTPKIGVSGHTYQEYNTLTFTKASDANGNPLWTSTQTIDLFQGYNWIGIDDGNGLGKDFNVKTTGGTPPVVSVTHVVDDSGSTYLKCSLDSTPTCIEDWNYLSLTGVSQITVHGTVDSGYGITTVGISLWNDVGAYEHMERPVDSLGNFSVTLPIYTGDNWLNFEATDSTYSNWWSAYLGVYTNAGSAFVPPIDNIAVTNATRTIDYGGSSEWDASPPPDSTTDNIVTITGRMNDPLYASYSVSSDGNWTSGTLSPDGTGSFALDVTLYNGWNWVSLEDGNGHSYGVNVYTSAGVPPQRPVIDIINGTNYDDSGSFAATACEVSIDGQLGSTAGNVVNASWSGSDGVGYYSEKVTALTDATGHFTVTLPLVSGDNSYNSIDLYDANWNWTGFSAVTSKNCAYVPPTNSIEGVSSNLGETLTKTAGVDYDGSSAALVDWGDGNYGAIFANQALTQMTISGQSSKANRSITSEQWVCGQPLSYAVTSDSSGAWSIPGIALYGGYNSIAVTDGVNWSYVYVNTTNNSIPTATMQVGLDGDSPTYVDCYGSTWDAGTATTVTISGTTTAPAGEGWYYADSVSTPFTINEFGAFSFTIDVYDGTNNVNIIDTNGTYQTLTINTSNGVVRPQYLAIDSPLNGTTASGLVTVTGSLDLGFAPSVVRAYVYDSSAGSITDYSSDVNDGSGLLNYDAAAGTFSFETTILNTNSYTEVYVYAEDASYAYHYHEIYLNDTNLSGSYGKPSTGSRSDIKTAVQLQQKLKRLARAQARGQAQQ